MLTLTIEILPLSPSSYPAPYVAPGGRMRERFAHSTHSGRSDAREGQIGSRLRARRTHLGLTIDSVARELGIKADQYLAYEAGTQLAPELLLVRIAESFGVPAMWFSANPVLKTAGDEKARPRPRGLYRVATAEDRVGYLVNVFCKLDLERQQQLLAVAGELARQQ
jgi:transcriptional regulator with XRE-family HTH domain